MIDMNILVVGSVKSTLITIKSLLKHNFHITGILGYHSNKHNRISEFVDLSIISNEYGIDFKQFLSINDEENIKWASDKKPDIIFAIGLSQLISQKWIDMPKLGCIGFHPTPLPKGRGRAAVAWSILEERTSAVTFFLLDTKADNGPIFIQKLINVDKEETAETLYTKIYDYMDKALDQWLPDLKIGHWNPIPQDHSLATWFGKRSPEDGRIDWNASAEEINLLIKATSKPHPGAFTFYLDSKIIINSSKIEHSLKIKGVIGGILKQDEIKGFLIQTGDGLLWINKIDVENNKYKLKTGMKLGYDHETALYQLFKLNKVYE